MPKNQNSEAYAEASLVLLLAVICVFGILLTVWMLTGGGAEEPPADAGVSTVEKDLQTAEKTPIYVWKNAPLTLSDLANAQVASADLYSQGAILVNGSTGAVVMAKNADLMFSPASMTKVMTLLVMAERFSQEDLERQVTLTEEVIDYVTSGNYVGASVSLIDKDKYTGDTFSVRDLLFGIGVESAADCTMMLVGELCPASDYAASERLFADWMNQKAAELGLTHTHFDNAIGYDSANNYTTVGEMAVIAAYAMECPLIAEILGTEYLAYVGNYEKNGVPTTYPRSYSNTFFKERMETFRKNTGKEFSLPDGWKVTAAKTGSFGKASFLVCKLQKTGDSVPYYLVLGAAEKSTYPASVYTLFDVQTSVSSYLK